MHRATAHLMSKLLLAASVSLLIPQAFAASTCVPLEYYPHGSVGNKFYRCDGGPGVLVDFNCPGGLVFNPAVDMCDWPESSKYATQLTAGPAQLTKVPLQVKNLNARLTYGTKPRFVVDGTVTFTTPSGQVLCSARTNFEGLASCDATGTLPPASVLLGGYIATYHGNGTAQPSTAKGKVNAL